MILIFKKTDRWLKNHRKREKKIAETVMGKALITIDKLASLDESEDPRISLIYRIAHSASGLCESNHKDWLIELDKIYKELRGK